SDSTILLTGTNFGCGSSREHAPWSILDYGFRVIIAPGFADIFYNNCLKIGLLPIVLPENTVAGLAKKASGSDGLFLSVDLASQIITGQNFLEHFEIDPFRKDCLLKGLDEIGLTLEKEA
ncbi:3-isopropylmalate dehydratase small subunit, partial [Vibrio parahaemolyticus]|uniref:3-isopropylmalate dehydratase small subunit n=1 Tax=Vibrio parahaemolyticus TaxID=670 RepID=UPI00146ECF06